MKTVVMAVLLIALLPGIALGDCEVGEAMKQAASGRFDTEKKLANDMAQYQRQVATAEKSCLNKYRDISMTAQVGMPSMASILQGIVNGLDSQACQAIDGAISQTTGLVGSQAVLPGGVGYVNTSVIYGNAGSGTTQVPVAVRDTIPTVANQATQSLWNKFKGLFF